MGHTLVLEVPEEVFEPLARTADQIGQVSGGNCRRPVSRSRADFK